MRRSIADRLGASYREAVHVTITREIDAERLVGDLEADDERYDVDISLLDRLLVAVSATLEAHPAFNGTFEEGRHIIYDEHNIAIAVDVEDGLLTPVLADVASLSVPELAVERRRLTEIVHTGEYSMSHLQNGTFTVSNLGPLGVDSFTPVINPPQVAILGVGRLRDRAHPSGDDVEFRRLLTVDLSFDHRVVDGADAARFLGTLAGHVEGDDT